jgi:hypothetical protein
MMPTLPASPSFLLLLISLALSGCLGTPLSSLPRLARLDFLTMDFSEVRAGLRLPAALGLRPGDAVMTVKTRTEGSQAETVDRFVLVEATEPAERAPLAGEAKPGFALSVWQIAPGDVPRLAAIQERSRASREHGPRIRGSVEIRVSGGCARQAIPAGPLAMSSYLKPARDESFITLNSDADLREALAQSGQQGPIPAC